MVQPSPYTPGAIAPEVPGRDRQLADFDERLDYLTVLHRLVPRIRIDHAPRGVGKTSLLRQVQRHAHARNAATIWVVAGQTTSLVPAIASAADRIAGDWSPVARSRLRAAVDRLEVKVSGGVPGVASAQVTLRPAEASDPVGLGRDATREFEDVLIAVTRAAVAQGHTGVVVFIDEIQVADSASLETISYAWQNFQAEQVDLPVALFATGLPSSVRRINSAVSNAERFAYRRLTDLDPDAAAVALAAPATKLGVSWAADALEDAVAMAGGYPHLLQLIGEHAWRCAGLPDPGAVITASHVREAMQAVHDDVRELYEARLSRIDRDGDLSFVSAMASHGDGPVARSAIAATLGVPSSSLGPPRDRMLGAGIITESGHGKVQFAIPGFAAYIRERLDLPDLAADPQSPRLDDRAGAAAVSSLRQTVEMLNQETPDP
ncbi:AAA family ATPase [Rudaeicoccus suwonensis]|uniref:AAA ATPase-like protein n=1 Tax=Rudaeicoccus suwonensis TaxID=657409 RepID=A0A561DVF5_9MICO|nr:AAA family ATPase [Rudaeicoccus suwonensis]TWE07346.1 AAA ATPase-like protein [Rudaeicoccus suwonensis]